MSASSGSLKTIAVGGVPEHFNLPWLKLIGEGRLRDAGVEASWRDFPGGSGAMGAALNEGSLDVAMLLTEGAVAGIANGGTYRIVRFYTDTPLLWGIHVPAGSPYSSVEDIRGARYAISRFGSGSHLMAFAHAREMRWRVGELRFEVVGGLEGAIEAFERRTADVFLWEKFMTKPLVDAGRFRRLGEYAAPWPAFVVCASAEALATKAAEIRVALTRVFDTAAEVAASAGTAAEISRRYGLVPEDAAEWLRVTRWSSGAPVREDAVLEVLAVLRDVGLAAPEGRFDFVAI